MAGRVFATSDHHFSHANILHYANRPFKDKQQMDVELIKRWNETVDADDIVYHLGDFGFGKVEYLSGVYWRLNGTKYLIMGNHDGTRSRMQKIGFDPGMIGRLNYMIVDGIQVHMIHDPSKFGRDVGPGEVVLFGHLHNTPCQYDTLDGWVNCCVENWDYRPVLLETLINKGLTKNGTSTL